MNLPPTQMSVIEISKPGDPTVLNSAIRNIPECGMTDILIEVHAAGVNRPDVLQRTGNYAPPAGASDLPGLEVAGIVVAKGGHVSQYEIGDKVTALTPGGGYAHYCKTPAAHALPIPKGFSMIEAAALPENYFTVWHNVFERGALKKGETILIHGGSSGIGSTAIQLAKAFGANVITTVGNEDKIAFCKQLGADHCINYKHADFVQEVQNFTRKKGADIILDMVGGDYIDKNYIAAAMDGRIIQIAFLGGAITQANFARLMTKRLVHTGSTLRPQSDDDKARMAKALHENVWPLLETGQVKPIIDTIYPLEDAAKAHAHMETSRHMGKIMLTTKIGSNPK